MGDYTLTNTALVARKHAMVQGAVAPWRRILTRKDETLGRSDDLLDILALIGEHGDWAAHLAGGNMQLIRRECF